MAWACVPCARVGRGKERERPARRRRGAGGPGRAAGAASFFATAVGELAAVLRCAFCTRTKLQLLGSYARVAAAQCSRSPRHVRARRSRPSRIGGAVWGRPGVFFLRWPRARAPRACDERVTSGQTCMSRSLTPGVWQRDWMRGRVRAGRALCRPDPPPRPRNPSPLSISPARLRERRGERAPAEAAGPLLRPPSLSL